VTNLKKIKDYHYLSCKVFINYHINNYKKTLIAFNNETALNLYKIKYRRVHFR